MLQSSLARSARKSWWIILLSVVICTGIAAAVTFATVPVYQSTVRFYVFAPTATGQSALQADELARLRIIGYASLLTSEKIVEQISKASGVDESVETVTGMINANGDAETLILTANVRSIEQDEASAIASSIATNFNRLVNDLESAGNPEGAETVLNVVAGPTQDDNPVSPSETLNYGLGILIGLAIGMGVVIFRHRNDDALRSMDGLEAVSGLQLLATVPAAKKSEVRNLGVTSANSLQFEALRNLRTNLHFRSDADSLRALAVTSTETGHGVSSVAYNLAAACAEAGYRTLLIETDLRNPRLAERLGMSQENGLSDVLQHGGQFSSAFDPGPQEDLWIMCAGTASRRASELLSGKAMESVLRQAREAFDLIILDSAPLLPFADSRTLCALSDGVIVVARYGVSTPDSLRAGAETLELVGAKVLGLVFNAVPIDRRLRNRLSPEQTPSKVPESGTGNDPQQDPAPDGKRGLHVESQ
ncbi:tyrosine-protein kinase domain-containing protein [Arthrobacter sp. Hz1]